MENQQPAMPEFHGIQKAFLIEAVIARILYPGLN
jgi:hypothetical protein